VVDATLLALKARKSELGEGVFLYLSQLQVAEPAFEAMSVGSKDRAFSDTSKHLWCGDPAFDWSPDPALCSDSKHERLKSTNQDQMQMELGH
jgi:hypothetical protein